MKILFVLLCFCCSLLFIAVAQPKQKAEKEFLKQLNSILKNSLQQHWNYEGATMTIDSAFAINKEGILSVSVRYTTDSSFVRARMAAPVNKIQRVAYDLYIILEYKDDLVTFYESEPGSNSLNEKGTTNLFHIGAPLPEDAKYQLKLQKALNKLLKYYPVTEKLPQ
ncbi:hypothetical protein [Ferruginibacter profundus]